MDINLYIAEKIIPEIGNYSFFNQAKNPVDAVINIQKIIRHLYKASPSASEKNFIHNSAVVVNSYIGHNVKIYEGCTIRDSIIFDNTTVSHCSEVARSIVLKNCEISGFNYVGSSLLGERVWVGGLAAFASRRHDDQNVDVQFEDFLYETRHWKFGSIIGSDVKIGYGTHINPGCVIGQNSLLGPYLDIKYQIPENSLVSLQQKIKISKRRAFPNIKEN